MQSLDKRDLYGVVSEANLVKLAFDDVKVLRPIAIEVSVIILRY